MIQASEGDISISGLGIQLDAATTLAVGDRVQVVLPEVGIIRGFVRHSSRRIGIEFDFHSEELRERLIVALFTNGMNVNAQRPSALAVAGAVLKRLWSADLSVRQEPAAALETATGPAEKLSAITRLIPPTNRVDLKTPQLVALVGERRDASDFQTSEDTPVQRYG